MKTNVLKYIPTGSDNKNLIKNIIGTILIKGGGMVLALVLMPLYIKYFPDKAILGVWFTILNVLNWVLTFDLGIGNGLRNHLTVSLSENNDVKSKRLISSAYILLGIVVLCISTCVVLASPFINWNVFFNVSPTILPTKVLRSCVNITLLGILVSFYLRLVLSILYALQKAACVNAISLVTGILTALYLFIYPGSGDVCQDFTNLSISYALITNLPLIVASILVFQSPQLKTSRPSYKCYDSKLASAVLSLGISFLVLQIFYMIISVTDSWFITKFYAPQYCVDYQIYYKIFSLTGSIYMLALTPMWSAITKAYTEKRYKWLHKTHKVLYTSMVGVVLVQIIVIILLQKIINIWLGDNAIHVNYTTALCFALYGCIFSWVAVLSTSAAGVGKLRTQMWGYLFAVLIKVIGIVSLSRFFTNWVFVIVVTSIGLLPYCIAQPIVIHKFLKQHN